MRGSRTLRAAMMAAALSLSVIPSVAWAKDEALAEQLFSEGLAAMKAERWAAACEAFLGSNQADPSSGTEINLGVCNEKQKKYATAITYYEAAMRRSEATDKHDRAKLAKTEIDRLSGLVHKVQIVWKTPIEGATIARDGGERVSAASFMQAPKNVDPGKHTFELAAKGKKTVTKEIAIPETPGTSTLEFPTMEDAPVDKPGGGGGAGEGAGGGTIVVTNDGSGQRTVGIVVGGAGILALLAAVGVQILAKNEESKANDFLAKSKDESFSATDRASFAEAEGTRRDAAKNDQLIAIITGASGVVLLGVGAVLFFTAPSGKSSSGKPKILPVFGPAYAGGSLGLSF